VATGVGEMVQQTKGETSDALVHKKRSNEREREKVLARIEHDLSTIDAFSIR
jgi:hypothetical protein